MHLTGRERIMRLFKGQDVDRPSLKLWALDKGQKMIHEDYRPVYEAGLKYTDLFGGGSSPFDFVVGADHGRYVRERRRLDDEWDEVVVTLRTDHGDLREVNRVSRVGKPGYTMEHFVKCDEDLEKLLAVPYKPYPMDLSRFIENDAAMGDAGIVMFGLGHSAYQVYCLMGSEHMAMMRVESPELLAHAVSSYSDRLMAHVKAAVDAGLRGRRDLVFGWVGPELFLPPLMSPADFDEYVFKHDARLIDLIHDAGGYAWVHCHGRVKDFIDRFARMGVDMLNPIEPPPMGDVSLREAFQIADGRMALEGNIQIGDIITGSDELIRSLVDRAIDEAGERFVLGLTTGYMEVPEPPEAMIRNLLLYLEYGYQRLTGGN